MGLDMYLSKKSYVQNWEHNQKKHEIKVKFDGKLRADIKPERITYITEQVGYWRKANHIHHFFVQNVQGGNDECQESYVDIDQLKELRDLCKEVVEKKDEEFNKENLPTSSGFFFGGTEYDEYYYETCQDTINIIDELIKEEENKPDGVSYDYYYQASW